MPVRYILREKISQLKFLKLRFPQNSIKSQRIILKITFPRAVFPNECFHYYGDDLFFTFNTPVQWFSTFFCSETPKVKFWNAFTGVSRMSN
jgi:hypothetical protein